MAAALAQAAQEEEAGEGFILADWVKEEEGAEGDQGVAAEVVADAVGRAELLRELEGEG